MSKDRIGSTLLLGLLLGGCASSTGAGGTVQPASVRLLLGSGAASGIAQGLARQPYLRLQIDDGEKLLRARAAGAGGGAETQKAARAALGSAQESYRKLRFGEAVQELARAEAALAVVARSQDELALLGELALQRALSLLALEQRDAARQALSQAFTLAGKGPAPGQFPPRVESFISEARASIGAAGVREQEVETQPAGARLIVDGKEAGKGPARLRLPAGVHHLRAEALGHHGRGELFEAGARPLRLELAAASPPEVARQLLERGAPLGAPEERWLVLVLEAAPSRPVGWLSATEGKAELLWIGTGTAPSRLRCDARGEAALADCLGPQLYLAATGQPLRPLSPSRRPFYKTWWFWTIAGAVVVGGVTAGVIAGTRRAGLRVSIESQPSGR